MSSVRLAALSLLVFLCGCHAVPDDASIEERLQSRTVTDVREPTFSLGSPYSAEETTPYADVVRAENALVRRLFDVEDSPPVRLYLVITSASAGSEPWQVPSVDGHAAGAFDEGFGFIYVRPSDGAPSLIGSAIAERIVRHELVHLYARRAGLHRGPWFDEGLAREIESMRASGGTLRRAAFPSALVRTRRAFRRGMVDELLAWRRGDDLPVMEKAALYDHGQALVRFLTKYGAAEEIIPQARRVQRLTDEEIRATENAFGAWLAELDALAMITRGVRSESAAERAECASLLPVLAEQRAPELATRAADELALDLLRDDDCARSAATFLLFFRARALREEDVAALCDSADPTCALTGHALRMRRGERVDMEAARRAWSSTSERARRGLGVQRSLLPDL